METKKPIKPRTRKKMGDEIFGQYGKFMSGIQVNIMNLGKLKEFVCRSVIDEGKTIEEAYELAKDNFREN